MNILWIDPIVRNDKYIKSLKDSINKGKNNETKFVIK